MKFRLTYEGRLESNGDATHKHEIRKALHPQLKRLWEIEPNLLGTYGLIDPSLGHGLENRFPLPEKLGNDFSRNGYRFCPLATAYYQLTVRLDILFLRPDIPGGLIKSGDIDNRLKTLFDALRMPKNANELGTFTKPANGEDPFFVLLEDDALISHVSVETDTLLQPTLSAAGNFLANDARLVITTSLKPYFVSMDNLHFA